MEYNLSKKVIDLSKSALEMERNGYIYKLQLFKISTMQIDTLVYKDEKLIQKETIPFAQLTKKLKKEIYN